MRKKERKERGGKEGEKKNLPACQASAFFLLFDDDLLGHGLVLHLESSSCQFTESIIGLGGLLVRVRGLRTGG